MHVLAFNEDVQAPPQDAEELVELTPTAELHMFDGMGHCSIYGHTHEVLNPFIRQLGRAIPLERRPGVLLRGTDLTIRGVLDALLTAGLALATQRHGEQPEHDQRDTG
jgi:hypothetical protein